MLTAEELHAIDTSAISTKSISPSRPPPPVNNPPPVDGAPPTLNNQMPLGYTTRNGSDLETSSQPKDKEPKVSHSSTRKGRTRELSGGDVNELDTSGSGQADLPNQQNNRGFSEVTPFITSIMSVYVCVMQITAVKPQVNHRVVSTAVDTRCISPPPPLTPSPL
jgi:hypothetical protein